MSPPGNLLVATDFSADSRAAAQRAALLAAGQEGVRLTLLHVMNAPSMSALRELFGLANEADAELIADARRELEALAATLELGQRPAPLTEVRVGQVVQEILAASVQAGLLVLGAHGANPLRDLILGTTAERLLHRTRLPTLVVREAPRAPWQRVLVAVDFSAHAHAALRIALDLAPQAHFMLLHAFDNPYEGKLWLAGVDDARIRHYRQQTQQQALARLDALLQELAPAQPCARLVLHGDPAPLILAHEQEFDADLIVIGKSGQSTLEDLLIGSAARHILSDARCDVLVACAPMKETPNNDR